MTENGFIQALRRTLLPGDRFPNPRRGETEIVRLSPTSATRRQNACNVLIFRSRKPKVGTTRGTGHPALQIADLERRWRG